MSRKIVIHTDGSASVKDRTGGWGFIIRHNGASATRCGHASGTTISEMELQAIQRALRFLNATDIPVAIYTDSQYAMKALTVWGDAWELSGWLTSTGKPVSHVPLIKDIRLTLELHRTLRSVDIEWVRGHAGTHDNHIADDLAGQARRFPAQATWKETDWKFHRDYARKHEIPKHLQSPSHARHILKLQQLTEQKHGQSHRTQVAIQGD